MSDANDQKIEDLSKTVADLAGMVSQLTQVVAANAAPVVADDPEPDEAEEDVAAEKAAIKAQMEQAAQEMAEADELLTKAFDIILTTRDEPILDWICKMGGETRAEFAKRVIRAAIVAKRVDYREYHGGGGSSSKNPEVLADKLPRR